jgi:hypothetical protein
MTTGGRGRRADRSCPASRNKLAGDGRDRPEADGAPRYGDTTPAAGEAGPDRREGAGLTVTHLAHLEEEDHDPCSPPPQTITREEEDAVKVAQVDTDVDGGQQA